MVNIQDKTRKTPLARALGRGAGAVVSLLLFYGAEDIDGKARSLLHASSVRSLEAAVDAVPGGEDLDSRDSKHHRMPAHWSAWRRSKREFALLFDKRVNQQVKDKLGKMLIYIAATNGSLAILEMLLEKGVDGDGKDGNGQTPLSLATGNGQEAMVRLLLAQRGIEPDSKETFGQTPLPWASKNGHEAVARLLIPLTSNPKSITHAPLPTHHQDNQLPFICDLLFLRGSRRYRNHSW